MVTTDDRQTEQPDYPFLADARLEGLRGTYMGLRSFDRGGGVFPAVETLAKRLGISESTAHRHISRLKDHGVLEVEEQFHKGRQRTNLYTFPIPRWWVEETAGEGRRGAKWQSLPDDTQLSTCTSTTDVEVVVVRNDQLGRIHNQATASPLRGSGRAGPEVRPAARLSEDVTPGQGRTRAGWKLHPRRSIFYTHQHAGRLVDYFADLVATRDVSEKGKASKTAWRRQGWTYSANDLLDDHRVEEVESVLAWLFDRCSGHLPFPVVGYKGRVIPRLKVTKLKQVFDHYPRIAVWMSRGDPPEPLQEVPMSRPRGYYDRGEGFPMEAEVAVLVELFAKTCCGAGAIRSQPPKDWQLPGWRKTFRIALDHPSYKIPFEDIKTVVEALGDGRLELDFGRYHDPYDLFHYSEGEWERILGRVRAVLRREQNRSSPPPTRRPRWYDDYDDDFRQRLREALAADAAGTTSCMSSVEKRQHRYLVRAARALAQEEDLALARRDLLGSVTL